MQGKATFVAWTTEDDVCATRPATGVTTIAGACATTEDDVCAVPAYIEKYFQKRMERQFDWCDNRQRTAFIVNVICKNGGWCKA